jgi:hypothetical protein
MKTLIKTTVLALSFLSFIQVQAQQEKVWISGAARGIMYGDSYTPENSDDSTARLIQSGHTLVDMGVNVQPNENILIKGMVRIRNDYGGFWGSGVTFDLRELYIKGIIGGFLRYQIGNIDYKLTPYTFRNNTALINRYPGALTDLPLSQVQYDLFYRPENTWRQDGAAIDFALGFNKYVEEMKFDLFTTRINAGFGGENDRLYSGGSVVLDQGKYFILGANYANLYDFIGTSNDSTGVRNPVVTGSAETSFKVKNMDINVAAEFGRSSLTWVADPDAPALEDYFYDVMARGTLDKLGLEFGLGYRNVGPNFRSAGAQTQRINFGSQTRAFNRIGEDQSVRGFSMLDLYRDPSLYRLQIAPGLADYDPRYDNITPYGRATPNRAGFTFTAKYSEPKKRYSISADIDQLTDALGEGTDVLRNYTSAIGQAEVYLNRFIGWPNRDIVIDGRYGLQNTVRDGNQGFEDIDLATNFINVNLKVNLVGELSLLAEYRSWQTVGNETKANRNEYSEIEFYSPLTIDYNETLLGAGLQYEFSEKTEIRVMYQNFNWTDNETGGALPYEINSWTVFFNMKF